MCKALETKERELEESVQALERAYSDLNKKMVEAEEVCLCQKNSEYRSALTLSFSLVKALEAVKRAGGVAWGAGAGERISLLCLSLSFSFFDGVDSLVDGTILHDELSCGFECFSLHNETES